MELISRWNSSCRVVGWLLCNLSTSVYSTLWVEGIEEVYEPESALCQFHHQIHLVISRYSRFCIYANFRNKRSYRGTSASATRFHKYRRYNRGSKPCRVI